MRGSINIESHRYPIRIAPVWSMLAKRERASDVHGRARRNTTVLGDTGSA